MSRLTAVTLFSGGGGTALGLRDAGFECVGAVEYDEAIAAIYADNLGHVPIVAKVEDADPTPFIGIDALCASPVCTRASVANANRGESEADMAAAQGVRNWIRVTRPKVFVMENVTQYRDFESCKLILRCLRDLGYRVTEDNCNSADYGVPQTRRRLIVRAVLGGSVPPLAPTHYDPAGIEADGGLFAESFRDHLSPWNGWYGAIEDLLPTLPESQFAPWQIERLDVGLFDSHLIHATADNDRFPAPPKTRPAFTVTNTNGTHKAFLCGVQGEGGDLQRDGGTPSLTLTTAHDAGKYRAFLIDGDGNRSRPPTVLEGNAPSMTVQGWHGRRPIQMPRAILAGVRNSGTPAGTVRCHNTGGTPAKALLIEGDAAGDRPPTCRTSAEPSFTIKTASGGRVHRAWLEQGRVVAMTPRALARFQSFPDSYRLPESRKLAATVIGNAVPPLLSQRIMEGLRDAL